MVWHKLYAPEHNGEYASKNKLITNGHVIVRDRRISDSKLGHLDLILFILVQELLSWSLWIQKA